MFAAALQLSVNLPRKTPYEWSIKRKILSVSTSQWWLKTWKFREIKMEYPETKIRKWEKKSCRAPTQAAQQGWQWILKRTINKQNSLGAGPASCASDSLNGRGQDRDWQAGDCMVSQPWYCWQFELGNYLLYKSDLYNVRHLNIMLPSIYSIPVAPVYCTNTIMAIWLCHMSPEVRTTPYWTIIWLSDGPRCLDTSSNIWFKD